MFVLPENLTKHLFFEEHEEDSTISVEIQKIAKDHLNSADTLRAWAFGRKTSSWKPYPEKRGSALDIEGPRLNYDRFRPIFIRAKDFYQYSNHEFVVSNGRQSIKHEPGGLGRPQNATRRFFETFPADSLLHALVPATKEFNDRVESFDRNMKQDAWVYDNDVFYTTCLPTTQDGHPELVNTSGHLIVTPNTDRLTPEQIQLLEGKSDNSVTNFPVIFFHLYVDERIRFPFYHKAHHEEDFVTGSSQYKCFNCAYSFSNAASSDEVNLASSYVNHRAAYRNFLNRSNRLNTDHVITISASATDHTEQIFAVVFGLPENIELDKTVKWPDDTSPFFGMTIPKFAGCRVIDGSKQLRTQKAIRIPFTLSGTGIDEERRLRLYRYSDVSDLNKAESLFGTPKPKSFSCPCRKRRPNK